MSRRYYSSIAQQMSLTAAVSSSSLTMVLNSVQGLPASAPFTLVVDPDKPSEEIVTATAVAGTTLTVVRGEDGTASQAHTTGSTVRHAMSARDLREPQEHMDSSSGVHGLSVTDAVAGVTATQTFTNKVISGVDNQLRDVPQSAVTGLPAALTGLADSVAATATAAASDNAALIPAGVMLLTAASTAPAGWLLCDGSAVSRTAYSGLFAAIGTQHGAGDGSTTFNLPNAKGRTPVGYDASQAEFNAVGKTGGEKTHTPTVAEMAAHGHAITDAGHNHLQNAHGHAIALRYGGGNGGWREGLITLLGGALTAEVGDTIISYSSIATDIATNNPATTGVSVQNNGGGGAFNVLQPYIALNYIIKA